MYVCIWGKVNWMYGIISHLTLTHFLFKRLLFFVLLFSLHYLKRGPSRNRVLWFVLLVSFKGISRNWSEYLRVYFYMSVTWIWLVGPLIRIVVRTSALGIKKVNIIPYRLVRSKFLFPAKKPIQVTPCFLSLFIPSCFGLFREVPVILAEILISVRNQFRRKFPLWNWFLPIETHRSVTLIQWRSSGEAHHSTISSFC